MLTVHVSGGDVTRLLLGDVTWSCVDPGGFEAASFELATGGSVGIGQPVTIRWCGRVVWAGRVSELTVPAWGEPRTQVGCEGAGAVLKDRLVQRVYVDADMSRWEQIPGNWRLAFMAGNYRLFDMSVSADPDGVPSVFLPTRDKLPAPWKHMAPAFYYVGDNLRIRSVRWRRRHGPTVDPASGVCELRSYRTPGDAYAETEDIVQNILSPTNPQLGWFSIESRPAVALSLLHYTTVAGGGNEGEEYQVWVRTWVYGDHPVLVVWDADGDAPGVAPHDVVRDVLREVRGVQAGRIEASPLVLKHLVYRDPTSVHDVVQEMARHTGWHWGVWCDGGMLDEPPQPALWFCPRPAAPTVTLRPDECEDIDLSMSLAELYDTVMVRWQQSDGRDRVTTVTVPVPELTEAGLAGRAATMQLGVATDTSAQAIGRAWLVAQQLVRAVTGQITIRRDIQTQWGTGPAFLLRPGLDRVEVATPRGLRAHVARMEATVGQDGPVVRLELGAGANLLETLEARLEQRLAEAGET